MNYAEFLAGISFRFLKPNAATDDDGWFFVTRGDGSHARWLPLPGIPLDLFNATLRRDEEVIRSRLGRLCSIPKMSTLAIGAIVNQAVAQMSAEYAFVNVGVWNGFTLLCGLAGNPDRRCVGIDNFSQFGGPREAFLQRFEASRSPWHEFHDLDYADYFARVHRGPIGVYIYDGEHSYDNQLKGLQTAEPFFSEDCIVVVDDTNWSDPWQATLDFVASSQHEYSLLFDQTTCLNRHPSFWNGIMVLQRTGRRDRTGIRFHSPSGARHPETAVTWPPIADWNVALAPEQRRNAPLVSLVIAHDRAEDNLEPLIAGALTLTYPNVEIVVVDTVGSRLSEEVANGFGPRVRTVRAAGRSDLSATFRSGLDASRGEWVCFLDSEHSLPPLAIEMGLVFGRESFGRMHSASDWYDRILRSLMELTRIVLPHQTVILVDELQWGVSGSVAGRPILPFLERDGEYNGQPPDDATAIRELERMRRELDAKFIAITWPLFWWFDHYPQFTGYLRTRATPVLENDRLVVFKL